MGRHFLLLVMATVIIHCLGVSGRRHEGGLLHGSVTHREALPSHHGKHPRRGGLVARSRTSAGLARITPAQQNNTQVIAQVGGSVTIKCYTHYLGDEMVTWLKRDEDHLLTAGSQVYSSDMRISVAHIKHQELWELSLRDVRLSDAGLYECQLTTHPPTSLFFTLKVVEARAMIKGYPKLHFHKGHTMRLHCTAEQATEPPLYIFWFHNGSMVNYYPNKPVRITKHRYSSSLTISNVTWAHAGVYRCEPHLATPARITVYITGQPAAMHIEGENGFEDMGVPLSLSSLVVPLPLLYPTLVVLLGKW
ncbi:zwei Ig domain protein zig-8-like [Panulirus ornatus]|uniref:zwei Ig domain protein zig-8-like n=1 Tax=Panulirus ornatus TaxID=150431 RepID=UPI003A8541CC